MKLTRIVAVLFAPFTLAGAAQVPNTPLSSVESKLPGISQYRSWGAVNPEPYELLPRVAVLCAQPPPAQIAESIRREREHNPHIAYQARVYVTPGVKAAFKSKAKELPVGTIVVKEKLPSKMMQAPEPLALKVKTATTPELLTVMVKRPRGYDPSGGDWQYYVLDGTASTILADTRVKFCKDCHLQRKTQGFLFRDYVPPILPSPAK